MHKSKCVIKRIYFLGFTLIELLVLIGIMIILASMLLPSLSKARDKGKAIVCSGNLRQVGLTHFSYSNDYSYLPVWYDGVNMWHALLMREGYIQPELPFRTYYIKPSSTIFICPSSVAGEASDWAAGQVLPIWWSTNYAINKTSAETGYILSSIKSPSSKILNMETSYYATTSDWCDQNSTVKLLHKHNGGTNILFCDGHVKWFPQLQIPRNYIDGVSSPIGTYQDRYHWWYYDRD